VLKLILLDTKNIKMDNQMLVLNSCIEYIFTCPSCKESWTPAPLIENEGEDKTQIHCLYGCGYIFLEDYINEK
tara:strand:- start:76 stop:294 length:219 start_codon:yes stop_codon:yes gene_type:complete